MWAMSSRQKSPSLNGDRSQPLAKRPTTASGRCRRELVVSEQFSELPPAARAATARVLQRRCRKLSASAAYCGR